MADRAHRGDRTPAEGARHHLLVERPEILEAAAAAGDHHHVDPGLLRGAHDPARDLLRGPLALDARWHDQHREIRMPPVQDAKKIVHRRPARAGDDRDPTGQERQLPLAGRLEEPLFLQALLQLLESDLQRARSERLDGVADELVPALRLVHGEPAAGHDRESVLDGESKPPRLGAKEHRIETGVGILEREVQMAAGGGAQVRHLALYEDRGKPAFENGLQLAGQLGDGIDAGAVGALAEQIELTR